jgi:FkbM family methyltransferase
MSILSAKFVIKPDKIYFWYRNEPYGKYWEICKPYLDLKLVEDYDKITKGTEVKELSHHAHKSDIIRMKKLIEIGGIYLDIDTITVKPIDDLLHNKAVMCKERWYGLCNAVMMSEPNNRFITDWLESYFDQFDEKAWNKASVLYPKTIAHNYPDCLTVLEEEYFFYPCPTEFSKIFDVPDMEIPQNLTILHLWSSMNPAKLDRYKDIRHMLYDNSLYGKIVRNICEKYPSILYCFSKILGSPNSYISAKNVLNKITLTRETSDDKKAMVWLKHIHSNVFDLFIKIDDYKNSSRSDIFPNINEQFSCVIDSYNSTNIISGELQGDFTIISNVQLNPFIEIESDVPGTVTYLTRYGLVTLYKNETYIIKPFLSGGYWDEPTLKCLRTYIDPTKNIIEIGGHVGTSTLVYATFLTSGKIYVFEPQKKLYDLLLRNINQNRLNGKIIPFNRAVFYDNINTTMNSIDVDGGGNRVNECYSKTDLSCNFGGISLGTNGEPIQTVTIDSLGIDNVGYIHCDAQGSENFIFSSATNTINTYRPTIYFEDNEKHGRYLYEAVCNLYPNIPDSIKQFRVDDYCIFNLKYKTKIEFFNGSCDTLLHLT